MVTENINTAFPGLDCDFGKRKGKHKESNHRSGPGGFS
jgi:hypothetical protein